MAIKLRVNTGTDSVRVVAAAEKKPVIVPDSVALGADTTGNFIATIDAGDGIFVTPNTHIEQANVVISHADTSSVANTVNDALSFVRNVSIDQFGHIIGYANTSLNSSNFEPSVILEIISFISTGDFRSSLIIPSKSSLLCLGSSETFLGSGPSFSQSK